MRITETEDIAVVRPCCSNKPILSAQFTIAEYILDIRGSWVSHETKLREHARQHSSRYGRLNDICSIKAIDTAAQLSLDVAQNSEIPLDSKRASLITNCLALQCPEVSHSIEIKLIDELGYILPFHAVTFGMKVKIFIADMRDQRLP